ncbi:MAG TPA: DUF3987 domain-containing protein [Candidatus Acidoferrum sp.]|nr:DUF3987 domain-containing protein [Candidatus Acidoferrum sp.]
MGTPEMNPLNQSAEDSGQRLANLRREITEHNARYSEVLASTPGANGEAPKLVVPDAPLVASVAPPAAANTNSIAAPEGVEPTNVAAHSPKVRIGEGAPWPAPLAPEALYGLAGEIVRTLDPHTEADQAAILVQMLVAFGNVVGRFPHYRVEGDIHHTNLFAVLVGDTSKARKGTSWGQVRRLMTAAVDPISGENVWHRDSIKSGLSTGEGLIHELRDPKDDKDEAAIFKDKRLLVVEAEFARPLVVMARDGNVLSEIVRLAWDSGDLRVMTKVDPVSATDTHISLIGHITRDDLRRHLTATEQGNGFANRILWICARRSKCLPDGGNLTDEELAPLATRLRQAITPTNKVREMHRDDAAGKLWHQVYPQLSDGKPGLLGAVVSRAEAQVLRLSMIYALLDSSSVIRVEHLRAALAVWEYCEASAAHIFGGSFGDPVADTILAKLRSLPPGQGLTRTHIRDVLARHCPERRINVALDLLEARGLAVRINEVTGGRPVERWIALRNDATKAI